MEEKSAHSVTFELINRILLEYTPEYHNLKKIAEKDVGEELLDRINKFLEERQEVKPVEEIKKIVFEDTSKISEEDINDIVDAFVKFRSENTLTQIDKKSIENILILFNQWIAIGKGQQERVIPQEVVFEFAPSQKPSEREFGLEQQIQSLQGTLPPHELYGTSPFQMQPSSLAGIYSNPTENYQELDENVEFITRLHDSERIESVYSRKAEYKSH